MLFGQALHVAVVVGSDGSSGILGVGETPEAALTQALPSAVLRADQSQKLEVLPAGTLIERWEGSRDYSTKRRALPRYPTPTDNTRVPVFLDGHGGLDFFGNDEMTFIGLSMLTEPERAGSIRRRALRRPAK